MMDGQGVEAALVLPTLGVRGEHQLRDEIPILLDHGSVHKVYQIEGIPKSFIYDREGKMVAQSIDMRTKGQFLQMLAQAGLKE